MNEEESAHPQPLPHAGGGKENGSPSRMREGLGVGTSEAYVRPFRSRNTERARELRNNATPMERKLWRYLARSQLGAKFSRQIEVERYYADFLCHSRKLIVELDGFSHEARMKYDAVRDAFLRDAGFRILRFTNEDVRTNVEGVVKAIAEELKK